MKTRIAEILAGLLILMAILLLFHQRLVHGFWFSRADFLHHEAFEGCLVAMGIGVLLGNYLGRR